MPVCKIIQSALSNGCELLAEGENIRVTNINRLPASLKESIREYKKEIIDSLIMDAKAKEIGFMIGISGKVYTKTFSKDSAVYIERIGEKWEAWRETYHISKTIKVKIISSGSTFDYVLLKAKGYFDYIEKKHRKRLTDL